MLFSYWIKYYMVNPKPHSSDMKSCEMVFIFKLFGSQGGTLPVYVYDCALCGTY